MVVHYHGLTDLIVTNRGYFFFSNFWKLLCYFLSIKQRLFTAFYFQTDSWIERQNNTMEAYLRALVKFEQNDWAKLLPMVEFVYNNAKNSITSYTPFELNCSYHACVSFEEDTDPRSQSKSPDKLLAKLCDVMIVCQKNLHHAEELQKRAYNKSVKPSSSVLGDKVWLNSKYIKTKHNRKLEAKFFGPFQVLHLVEKQTYKLELLKW